MKRLPAAMSFLSVLIVLAGCASAPRAPVTASGAAIQIMILSSRGNPEEMTEKQWGWRNEVGGWMEPDLVRQLTRSGYSATLIGSRDDFEPAGDRYLLSVAITSYNPGSSAARIFVGYGAGACSLDIHYELYGAEPEPIMAWDDGVGTSANWQKLPRKLNINTVKRITVKLSE
jgi:hypothetical protein